MCVLWLAIWIKKEKMKFKLLKNENEHFFFFICVKCFFFLYDFLKIFLVITLNIYFYTFIWVKWNKMYMFDLCFSFLFYFSHPFCLCDIVRHISFNVDYKYIWITINFLSFSSLKDKLFGILNTRWIESVRQKDTHRMFE